MEMMITTLIFLMIILGVYFLFDRGRWLHLSSEKRANIQNNARMMMESMERDFRMIGYGVPTGTDVGGVTTQTGNWEEIFSGNTSNIGFTADIDNGNTILTADVGFGSPDLIYVEDTSHYSAATISAPIKAVIVSNGRNWDDVLIVGIISNSPAGFNALDASGNVGSVSNFDTTKGQVYTLERVLYRLQGDTNSDGVCNLAYPFCTLERAEFRENNRANVTPTTWLALGTHVQSLSFGFQTLAGAAVNMTTVAGRASVRRITISLTCSERDMRAGAFQTTTLDSEVLIRN